MTAAAIGSPVERLARSGARRSAQRRCFNMGGGMDVLVMLEENPEHSPVLAHVNSVPAPLNSERTPREVVTLYGVPSPESLALALAAAVESRRPPAERSDTIRHLGVWPQRGAIGDAAWRDVTT